MYRNQRLYDAYLDKKVAKSEKSWHGHDCGQIPRRSIGLEPWYKFDASLGVLGELCVN